MSAILYLEHLTDADLTLLGQVQGWSAGELLTHLRENPDYLEGFLQHPSVFAAIFRGGEQEALLRASPFLVFAVLVHRATRDLAETHFVEEWLAPGRRVPMFEVGQLREFASDPLRRLFLSELLASYTRVASGSVWVQTPRGWRRRRFSELDPLRLIELLEVVPEAERSGIYRRLGDLSLFLTGVFPDYAGQNLLRPLYRERLQRAMQRSRDVAPRTPELSGSIWLLEDLGRRSYHLAWQATDTLGGGMSRVLKDMSESFGQARRTLNFLTDRYIFPLREQWFSLG